MCGALVGPLFMVITVLEGIPRPGYSPLRHSISSLAVGSDLGWVQSMTFAVGGLLVGALALGLRYALPPGRRSAWGTVLVGLFGLGLIGVAVFVTDPEAGYPPGTPAKLPEPTAHGMLHNWFAAVSFLALLAAFFVLGRAAGVHRWWQVYSVLTAVVFLTFLILHNYTTTRTGGGFLELSGLYQRVAVTSGWAWLTALSLRLLHRTRRAG